MGGKVQKKDVLLFSIPVRFSNKLSSNQQQPLVLPDENTHSPPWTPPPLLAAIIWIQPRLTSGYRIFHSNSVFSPIISACLVQTLVLLALRRWVAESRHVERNRLSIGVHPFVRSSTENRPCPSPRCRRSPGSSADRPTDRPTDRWS